MKPSNSKSSAALTLENSQPGAEKRTLHDIFMDITSNELAPRQRFFHIMHGRPALALDARIAFFYNMFQLGLIFMSTALMMVETLPDYYEPVMKRDSWQFICECVMVAIFSVDMLLRVVSATSLSYIFTFAMVIDFASIVGFYVELIISTYSSGSRASFFIFLRFIRLFRVNRLLKLHRSQKSLTVIAQVVEKSTDGLLLLVVLVIIAILFFSSVMYYAELQGCTFDKDNEVWVRPDGTDSPYQSIPDTFWFVAVSITTVGYGDTYPYNAYGRAVAMVIMFFGVLVLSFPNILISSNFEDVHRSMSRNKARKLLGVWFRKVRMVVRFIRMWRAFRVNGTIAAFCANEDTGSNEDASSNLQREINFFMHSTDYPEYDFVQSGSLRDGDVDFCVQGLSARSLLQRLLEGFSCCATGEELAESFAVFPSASAPVYNKEVIFELLCHTSVSKLTSLFVIDRVEYRALACLSKRGLDILQTVPESKCMPCARSLSESREIWQSTTRQALTVALPIDGYRRWQETQSCVPRRSAVDYVYDHKLPEARHNFIFVSHGEQEEQSKSEDIEIDEEYLMLRFTVSQQDVKLYGLVQELTRVLAVESSACVKVGGATDAMTSSDSEAEDAGQACEKEPVVKKNVLSDGM